MNFLMIALLITTTAFAAPKEKDRTLPVKKEIAVTKPGKQPTAKAMEVLQDKEDCDDKAKKEVKIEPETVTLGGNTGCSLDEIPAH